MVTHSSILAWETHAKRSLAGCGPWDHKESDTTEHISQASNKGGDSVQLIQNNV